MKRVILTIFICQACLLLNAQQLGERVEAYTDKSCYLTGERMHVSVLVTDKNHNTLDLSKVAYVEIADTARMVAHAMMYLKDGQGWAEVSLPEGMHSGNYMLTAYTRAMRNEGEKAFCRKIISVINPEGTSQLDNITFMKEEDHKLSIIIKEYQAGQGVRVALPKDSAMIIRTLSVVRGNLRTAEYTMDGYVGKNSSQIANNYVAEMEGHIVMARSSNSIKTETSRMVMIGKGADVYDGQQQADGTWLYYTHDVHAAQPTLINGYDNELKPAPLEFITPYVQSLPESLPRLQVWCSEQELKERSIGAQQEQALVAWMSRDTLAHTGEFLSKRPDYSYDMDEYTKFNTVREALLEFVKGVRKRKVHGTNQLFTISENKKNYTDWPALVLLDGMPVYDVDDILGYDARLLKYIEVYSGVFTFGTTVCQGVISFVSRHGLLSNYTLDEGSRLVTYEFPQDHPNCLIPAKSKISTVYWNPAVNARQTEFPAPQDAGNYQIILQGTDAEGHPFESISEIRVN
ncbi:MAG: hypothetical protein J5661_04170 [Bacteroidaceae bacterium]|nr:hypothetical protein [Bacteroidaceae bacterium]